MRRISLAIASVFFPSRLERRVRLALVVAHCRFSKRSVSMSSRAIDRDRHGATSLGRPPKGVVDESFIRHDRPRRRRSRLDDARSPSAHRAPVRLIASIDPLCDRLFDRPSDRPPVRPTDRPTDHISTPGRRRRRRPLDDARAIAGECESRAHLSTHSTRRRTAKSIAIH